MTKYAPILELFSSLGFLLDTLHGDSATYTSHILVDKFLTLLGHYVRLDIASTLQNSPCSGVICDETTDTSTFKQLNTAEPL